MLIQLFIHPIIWQLKYQCVNSIKHQCIEIPNHQCTKVSKCWFDEPSIHSWTHAFTKARLLTAYGCKVAASGGWWLLPNRISRSIFAPTKGTKANGMDKRNTPVNNIRFKSGLLCPSEHSKVCFLLHETAFAAQNSLLYRGVRLTSKVALPIHTCRKHQVVIICQIQNNKDEQQEE